MSMENYSPGLEGVVAGTTAISTVGKKGRGLTYRGIAIEDLAGHASFEEVAHLLIHGTLPQDEAELDSYRKRLTALRALPDALQRVLEQLPPTAHPMDVLRTGCSALGTMEPEVGAGNEEQVADRLVALFPSMLLHWYQFHRSGARLSGASDEPGIAAHFLRLLHGSQPDELRQRAVDVSLILYAEHEFNASTFSARVTASTLSDFYSAITSAIGTLRGPLHGGANEEAIKLIERFTSPDDAQQGLMQMLAAKEKVMGFGHRIYKYADPRSAIARDWALRLCGGVGDARLCEIAERIEEVMYKEKNLFPNLDFYTAIVYRLCGIPTEMFTPLFVFARVAGWSAHIIEQRSANRIFRPIAEYVGPERQEYVPIGKRR
ncbi:2-methylcitrate synthase [Geomonas sp. RF6]|uniref:citrate/2-methylcitrate synthase n=1 Tax=Geomonas sp. RF6 TaxID=2897342 RepID=UPI001E59E937|nr:citrate/2-methylcitrate synthase [Geomonas sp. RF6]UFS70907.1 2-methylcitrate synthase [Geomonas sp. RF6]